MMCLDDRRAGLTLEHLIAAWKRGGARRTAVRQA